MGPRGADPHPGSHCRRLRPAGTGRRPAPGRERSGHARLRLLARLSRRPVARPAPGLSAVRGVAQAGQLTPARRKAWRRAGGANGRPPRRSGGGRPGPAHTPRVRGNRRSRPAPAAEPRCRSGHVWRTRPQSPSRKFSTLKRSAVTSSTRRSARPNRFDSRAWVSCTQGSRQLFRFSRRPRWSGGRAHPG